MTAKSIPQLKAATCALCVLLLRVCVRGTPEGGEPKSAAHGGVVWSWRAITMVVTDGMRRAMP